MALNSQPLTPCSKTTLKGSLSFSYKFLALRNLMVYSLKQQYHWGVENIDNEIKNGPWGRFTAVWQNK